MLERGCAGWAAVTGVCAGVCCDRVQRAASIHSHNACRARTGNIQVAVWSNSHAERIELRLHCGNLGWRRTSGKPIAGDDAQVSLQVHFADAEVSTFRS